MHIKFKIFPSPPKPPGTLCPENIRHESGRGIHFQGECPFDEFLAKKGLWERSTNLKLHLGCGQKIFRNYINIDYPSDKHTVMKNIQADVYSNILEIFCNPNSVSEIRLHHVFEHFNRVTALAQLFRWSQWLHDGGKLIIETPDLEGMAKTFLKNRDFSVRMGIARAIAGDQSSDWGYHLEHWWPERYVRILSAMGYKIESVASERWEQSPFLSNVVVIAVKKSLMKPNELRDVLYSILRESMINETEQKTFEVWKVQLDDLLNMD